MSPTQRTLQELRKRGILAGVVERWIAQAPPAGKRVDFLGFIDVIAVGQRGIVGIQCCAGSGHAAHRTKIVEDCRVNAAAWLQWAEIELWSWRKLKLKRGGKAVRWTPRIETITQEDVRGVLGENVLRVMAEAEAVAAAQPAP